MANGTFNKYADGSDSTWIEIKHANITGSINLRRIGNIVNIFAFNLTLTNDFSSGNYITIGKVPNDCRPYSQINFPAGNSAKFGQLRVGAAGDIYFFRPISNGTWTKSDSIHFCMTYITA
jgi:hypothetical protein